MSDELKQGVYAIVHAASGKRYVGSASRSFSQRWRQHRQSLNKGKHHSVFLQRAWNKYGEDAFEFKILRITEPHEAVEYEQAFIDLHKSADPKHGYNILPIAGSSLGVQRSATTKAKIGAYRTGKKHSPETKAQMSRSRTGLKASEAARSKRAKAQTGRTHSPETKVKLSKTLTGREFSHEWRNRISNSLTAHYLRKRIAKATAFLVMCPDAEGS